MSGLFDVIPWDDPCAPLRLEHWEQWARLLARLEMHGNDGADVYEAEELGKWVLEYYRPEWGVDLFHEMKTWVMQRMGAAFDPEKHCEYTGRRLWQFPFQGWDGRYLMGYYREPDAYLMRVRDCTAAEMEWITGNPVAFGTRKEKFQAWQERAKLSDLDG